MPHISLASVGNVFKKKDRDLHPKEEEEEDPDASEFEDDEEKPAPKPKSRRPKETPFTQQRIASINPIVTPRGTMLLYVVLAVIFVISGAALLRVSAKVDQMLIYYQDCSTSAPTDAFGDMGEEHFKWSFHKDSTYNQAPQWKYTPPTSDDAGNGTCQIRFTTPRDLPSSVYLSYRIEEFYGNHRRYVLSFSEDQIKGEETTISSVKDNPGINCKPMISNHEGKQYYPCGLIANSMFNDTFSYELQGLGSTQSYALTNKGISWSTDKNRFKKTKLDYRKIAPPPNWAKAFPDGYNATNVPDINEWEEFQNWMRTPAFAKFQKLIRRNDNDTLPAGEYQIDIGLNWPVLEFGGKKAIFLTHGSSIGGKNNFLGIVFLIGGVVCFGLAVVLLATTLISGRSAANLNNLSWNQD
ncbi:Alkylphosphocholine resistance protein LEM3 [Lachancea thermotolerans]